MTTTINWETGTPEKSGDYLVLYKGTIGSHYRIFWWRSILGLGAWYTEYAGYNLVGDPERIIAFTANTAQQ